jgi:hypothetical protein
VLPMTDRNEPSPVSNAASNPVSHDHGDQTVPIFVNKDQYFVNRGPETVAYIKEVGHVPAADELEELIQGKLEPLADNGTVDVKGGEKFFSHPRTGSSS